MTLNIVPGSEPIKIDSLNLLIYGDPGAGKTSLAFTADNPLLLDFDRGAHRSAFRGDIVPISAWPEVAGMGAGDLAPYETVVVDTVGRALDLMATDIMANNPKARGYQGALSLQGYGILKSRFAAWMTELRTYGKDVVLVAHGKEERKGDDLIVRPDITGGSYAEVFKVADGVAHLTMVQDKRTLNFNPSEAYVGKNPASLQPMHIPDLTTAPGFLAGLIQQIKDSIGELSAEGQAVAKLVSAWGEELDGIEDADALTAAVGEVNADLDGPALRQVKVLIKRRAEALGLQWNRKDKRFEQVPEGDADAA